VTPLEVDGTTTELQRGRRLRWNFLFLHYRQVTPRISEAPDNGTHENYNSHDFRECGAFVSVLHTVGSAHSMSRILGRYMSGQRDITTTGFIQAIVSPILSQARNVITDVKKPAHGVTQHRFAFQARF